MWQAIFDLPVSVWEKILRAVLVYVFLLLALRVGGKRELGQLNTLDFIVLLAVANAVQNGIIGNDDSVTGAVIGATTLLVVNGVAFLLALRSGRLRRFLIGAPTLLVQDGVVITRNLRRERMSDADLEQAIVEAGGRTIADAKWAVIEPNGHIAVTLGQPEPETDELRAIREELRQIREVLSRNGN